MTRRAATLRARLLATAMALALVPTLVTGGAILVYGVRERRAQVSERNESLARALAGEVRQFLLAQRALTQELALEAALSRARGPEAVEGVLAVHLRTNPAVEQQLLLALDGRVVHAMPPDDDALGLDLSRERYVREALARRGPAWAISESLRTGEAAVVLAVPSEAFIAVSFLDVHTLEAVLLPGGVEWGRKAAVVARDGTIVAASDHRLADQHVVLAAPFLVGPEGKGPRSAQYRFQEEELLGSAWPVEGSPWAVLVSEPLEQATGPVRRFQLAILALLAAFGALGATASAVVSRRVVQPFEALSSRIRRVEEGAYHEPLPPVVPGYREVDELARAFGDMASAVRSREEALARSERSYRTLVDNSLVGVGRFTPEGTLVFCNEALARFFGAAAPDEVVGSSCLELYRDPAQHGVLLAAVEKHGKVTNFEIQAGARDEAERSLLLNVTREGELLSVVAVDISELKRAAADRERLEHQLLVAQKMEAVGRLAGGIAHDFNNLLTAVIGFAGVLKEELGRGDPRCEAVEGILQSAHRASNLTRSLLAYSRKQFMQPRPVDLCDIVRTVDKLLRRIIGEDVELLLALPERLPVVADPGHLEQVLVNLCTNARDAMPGGGRLRISGDEVELDAAAAASRELAGAGRYARVRVEDSGRGMSPEVMARVFEPFYTTKSATSGSGLGLSIVYGIMRQQGGHVELASELGRGTVVTLLFPLHAGKVEVEVAVPGSSAPRGKEMLLLAEDEPLVRAAVQSALRRAGYEVVEAVDGEEAVERFSTHRDRIALCVLDVVMPRKNGREAAEAITALRPGTPILLASGYAADVLEARGHGGIGLEVIAKPFTPEELLRRIRERLDRG